MFIGGRGASRNVVKRIGKLAYGNVYVYWSYRSNKGINKVLQLAVFSLASLGQSTVTSEGCLLGLMCRVALLFVQCVNDPWATRHKVLLYCATAALPLWHHHYGTTIVAPTLWHHSYIVALPLFTLCISTYQWHHQS